MQPAQPSLVEMLLPFVFIFAIFYFLIIRPQSKKVKEHDSFLSALKRGDQVVTNSGILGTVDGLTDQFVTLEIADGVRIKMLKKQISGSQAAVLQASNNNPAKK
ncbi:MAG: preprotein translocase subunit YajC [Bdellovibrio sp.]